MSDHKDITVAALVRRRKKTGTAQLLLVVDPVPPQVAPCTREY